MIMQKKSFNFPFPKVWELLDRFKELCQLKGWKISEHEDWVKTNDDKYHIFLCIPTVNLSTFTKITTKSKCAIRQDLSYKVVNFSYSAWLFSKNPPENLVQQIIKNPKLLRKTAVFDFSRSSSDEPLCLKLNETASTVLGDFERFLEEDLEMTVKPVRELNHFENVGARMKDARVLSISNLGGNTVD